MKNCSMFFLCFVFFSFCSGSDPLVRFPVSNLPEECISCSTAPARWCLQNASNQDTAKIYATSLPGTERRPTREWGFATLKQVEVGKTLQVPVLDDKLPPRKFASSFANVKPKALLSKLGFNNNSFFPMMQESYHVYCEASKFPGEMRECFASKAAMISFLNRYPNTTLVALKSYPSYPLEITISKVTKLPEMHFICHSVVYPISVFSCHLLPNTSAIMVEGLSNSQQVSTVLICHFNTTMFAPTAPGLVALNLKPGEGEVCHFYAQNDILGLAA